MVEDISRTLKKKSLDGIFNEVVHNEKLGISNNEELHLFYLAVRGNKFYTEDLQTALYVMKRGILWQEEKTYSYI